MVLIPGPIGARCVTVDHLQLDQGSVNAPPPLEHRQSGVGWSLQAASHKLQAASFKLDKERIKDYIGL